MICICILSIHPSIHPSTHKLLWFDPSRHICFPPPRTSRTIIHTLWKPATGNLNQQQEIWDIIIKTKIAKQTNKQTNYLLTFLMGLPPPPNSAGSTVLYPPLSRLLLCLLGGLCSSMTSTISSSGCVGALDRLVVSSTTILSLRLLSGGLLTSATSLRDSLLRLVEATDRDGE